MLRVVQGEEGEGNYWTCFDLLNHEFEKIFYMFCDDITNSIQGLDSELKELNTIKDRIEHMTNYSGFFNLENNV